MTDTTPSYLFVTGNLAIDALRGTLERMAPDFDYEIAVLDISVTALMKTPWIARHLEGAHGCQRVMISGWCQGDLSPIEEKVGVEVVRGPKDLRDLPAFFGHEPVMDEYGEYQTEILAEIVEAYQMEWGEILARAEYYRACGADIIDLGCPVDGAFPHVEEVVAGLKARGFVVSLDTFDPDIILRADGAGLDLLLSVNGSNMEIAPQLQCKVVVVPDFDQGLASLERNVARLEAWGVPYVIDPILNPIHFGFTESLYRFYEARRRYPQAEMLMGVANLTELTEADSTGIHAVMAGIVAELGIEYVLTTEVIGWARGAVRELDIARRMMDYAQRHRVLPKFIDGRLVTVKEDLEGYTYGLDTLQQMHQRVRDRNWRIFTGEGQIYVFNAQQFVMGTDPEEIFAQLDVQDGPHAFYLGQELERAALAVQLGKRYTQEDPLDWGYLNEWGQDDRQDGS